MAASTRILLATHNRHKVAEIRAILSGLPYEILDASAIDSPPDPEETGSTMEENAIIKAKAFYEVSGLWSLADDSGLEIDALGGDPGVRSARYAGPGCTFADNNRKVLRLMNGVPEYRRGARFRCVAALAMGPDTVRLFEGTVEGRIIEEARGTEGFGYDPIFFSPELGHTFAEATPDEKNRISHRGRAFRAVAEYLRGLNRT
ncbi:MAG: XTP/dITP diphosphatase [Candidatus Zixiibacteriota bacterium]